MSYQTVVIIGAPRSGTNMLRDVLTELPGIETWPCDEINYVWRHGNVRFPHDEIPAERATAAVSAYIRREFDKLAAKSRAEVVVEKTCANSLRVPFVERVLPDAKFVFIFRDGVDVVGSAMKRWKAGLDVGYLARKSRFVPPSDLFYYASRYALNRIQKLVSSESRLAAWGPRLSDMDSWQERYDLSQMCALQWRACVEKANRDLQQLDSTRVHSVRYEDFVARPAQLLSSLLDFIGRPASRSGIELATRTVLPGSVGRGRSQMSEEQLSRVLPLIDATLRSYGYND